MFSCSLFLCMMLRFGSQDMIREPVVFPFPFQFVLRLRTLPHVSGKGELTPKPPTVRPSVQNSECRCDKKGQRKGCFQENISVSGLHFHTSTRAGHRELNHAGTAELCSSPPPILRFLLLDGPNDRREGY